MNIQRSACLTGLSLFPNPLGTIIQSQKNIHNGSSSLTQGFSLSYTHSFPSLCLSVSSSFSWTNKNAARCCWIPFPMLGWKELEVAAAGRLSASLCVAVYFVWCLQPSLRRSRLETTTLMTPGGRSLLRLSSPGYYCATYRAGMCCLISKITK